MVAVSFLILILGQSVPEGPPPPAPAVQPRWLVPPHLDPPSRLVRTGVEAASATINCRANADGSVDDCLVAAEDPPGTGLGSALARAAREARVDPASLGPDGSGRVSFTARFRLD